MTDNIEQSVAHLTDKIVNLKEVDDIGDIKNDLLLKDLEKKSLLANFHLVKELAISCGQQIADSFTVPTTFQNKNIAYGYRFLVVPLLYKLGLSAEAALLNQTIFEYVYPAFHHHINQNLVRLYGEQWLQDATLLIKSFQPNDTIDFVSRIKSTQSIWKKIPSLHDLEKMDLSSFSNIVEDLLAVRWFVFPQEHENRFDAAIRGVIAAPKEQLVGFRNQFLKQQSGFSEEPVIKMTYRSKGFAIELQILGGNIDYYMSAKGYANYKTGLSFPPSKGSLSEQEWNARLGTIIQLQETNELQNCRLLLLTELIEGKAPYHNQFAYVPENKPNKAEHSQYQFEITGCKIQPSTCPLFKAIT